MSWSDSARKEKNKVKISMNRWIKFVFIFVYVFIFLGIVTLKFWLQSVGPGFFSNSLYWMILLGWLFLTWNFKWKSSVSMSVGFILFVSGAFFTTFGFRDHGETVMRLSFIGWMVGVAQALVEYRKNENS